MNRIEENLLKLNTPARENVMGNGGSESASAGMNHIACYLKDIHSQDKIGRLIVHSPLLQKHLIFHSGCLVFAQTDQGGERLGRILYKLGKLSWESYTRIESYITSGGFIGEALIRHNLISRQDLKEALLFQMKTITLNLFPVHDAEFRFQDIDEKEIVKSELKIPIPDLISEGIRGIREFPDAERLFRGKKLYPQENSLVRILNGRENTLFYQIRSGSTIEDLSSRLIVDPVVLFRCLFLFYCLNLVDVKEEEGDAPAVVEHSRSSEVMSQKKRIENEHSRLMELNYYQLLDVPRSASALEAKEAYYRLARLYHPDLFSSRLPSNSKTMVEQIFDRINKAYQTIFNEGRRRIYDTQLDRDRGEGRENVQQQAEASFRKGLDFFQKSRYEDALSFLLDAIRLEKNKAAYFLLLGRTKSRIPLYRKQAEAAFKEALRLEPWNAEGYVDLGIFYREEGLPIKAGRQFEKALNIEPDNRTARAELKNIRSAKKGHRNIFRRS
ncbi:MAG: J domain-containing protein [Acidobacteriota bacterium]